MRYRLSTLLLATAVAGCATGQPPELGYLPPAGPPVNISRAVVAQPRELVWTQVIDHLQQAPVEITQIDEQAGIIVALYRGDPEPYITCGWIVSHRRGDLNQTPASIQQTTFERIVDGRRMALDRNLRLDGRIVVEVTPRGDDTVVTANSTYVLTKIVNTGRGGNVRGQNVETLSFGTGDRGQFEKGTVCQPTGALELAALGALPVVASTALASRVVDAREPPPAIEDQPLQPFEPEAEAVETAAAEEPPAADPAPPADEMPGAEEVPAAEEMPAADAPVAAEEIAPADEQPAVAAIPEESGGTETAPEPPPPAPAATPARPPLSIDCGGSERTYCALVELLAPYRQANQRQQYGLSVSPVGDGPVLEEGTELALDLGLPGFEAYLDVSYLQRDGSVGHLLPEASRLWPAYGQRYVQDTGYEIAEPFGLEMIVVIATETPLFPEDRPRFQSAESYLADLRRRLDELRAANPTQRIVASHTFVRTVPTGDSS